MAAFSGNGIGKLRVVRGRIHEDMGGAYYRRSTIDARHQAAGGELSIRQESPMDGVQSMPTPNCEKEVVNATCLKGVDAIELSGPEFSNVDNRVLALALVEQGLTDAVLFDSTGKVCIPSDKLRKKNILLMRGAFRPFTNINTDMIQCAASTFLCDNDDADECVIKESAAVLTELTLKDLREAGDELDWTEDYQGSKARMASEFLSRVDTICAMGYDCLVSNYFEYFKVAGYLRRSTKESIVITLGVPAVRELFNDSYYKDLEGGILENFGRLLRFNLKLYVYPTVAADGSLITASNLELDPAVQPLYEFMYNSGSIIAMEDFDEEALRSVGNQSAAQLVLEKIKNKDDSWKDLVPPNVAKVIMDENRFGC
ncbi:hypothetical protein CYMTET_28956 [Cymbomonas tetramitiformis]|uniref:Uncharacterized protein n=1 Tax=Cymbomonas tetramitiformis TaxID=36881 RepID=A0AAE0KVM6_9CHLO|nr:hypothetical protein CYMTET_28956 [Cymbomonas tetramitiformis]